MRNRNHLWTIAMKLRRNRECDYDKDEDQLEAKQEEETTEKITETTNQIF